MKVEIKSHILLTLMLGFESLNMARFKEEEWSASRKTSGSILWTANCRALALFKGDCEVIPQSQRICINLQPHLLLQPAFILFP